VKKGKKALGVVVCLNAKYVDAGAVRRFANKSQGVCKILRLRGN